MALFGQNPSQGTLLKASEFLLGALHTLVPNAVLDRHCLTEELPIRLAHRIKELDQLPHNLSDMPSIQKVKNWYGQSFDVSSSIHASLLQTHSLIGAHQLSAHSSTDSNPAGSHGTSP